MEALSSLLEEQSRTELGANNSCFELFGYDFMMDDDMKLVLIEVNTNPCLETESCPLLSRLISQVVDQTFKVAVDPFFDGTENEIGLSQEYPISEIKMEMVVCRNLRLPEPGEDEAEQRRQNLKHESDDEVIDREDEGRDEDQDACGTGECDANLDASPIASDHIGEALP